MDIVRTAILGVAVANTSPQPPAEAPAKPPEEAPLAVPAAVPCPPDSLKLGENCVALPDMITAPSGLVMVGSPKTEPGRSRDEAQTELPIPEGFKIMATEITQAMWMAVMGDNASEGCPGHVVAPHAPVGCVSWNDAVSFANRLSEAKGLEPAYLFEVGTVVWNREANGYRLPTEAEWEYAARAEEPAILSGGDRPTLVAWTRGNSLQPARVATLRANAWGLYDMSGNVAEWVWDAMGKKRDLVVDQGTERIFKGGSWADVWYNARIASRASLPPSTVAGTVGFRLAQNP